MSIACQHNGGKTTVLCGGGLREIVKVDEICPKTGTNSGIYAGTLLSVVQSSILVPCCVPKFDLCMLLVWLNFDTWAAGASMCLCGLLVRIWRAITMSLWGAVPLEVLVHKCLFLEPAKTSSQIHLCWACWLHNPGLYFILIVWIFWEGCLFWDILLMWLQTWVATTYPGRFMLAKTHKATLSPRGSLLETLCTVTKNLFRGVFGLQLSFRTKKNKKPHAHSVTI